MAVSSDPPAVGVVVKEPQRVSAAQVESAGITDHHHPSAADSGDVAATTEAHTTQLSEQQQKPAERKTEEHVPVHDDDHGVNPLDFEGAVKSNNDLPSAETLRKIENYVVLDRDGKSLPFKSLYTGRNVARRVLIIFVRHFYCGNCQEYLRTLSAAITPDSLLRLPISTFIAVVGCGDPGLIPVYTDATGCPFPVYADPTRKLYTELGMIQSLALGTRPAYMKKSLLKSSLDSIVQGLKQIPKGFALKGGDHRQIGGEFLFEPISVFTPLSSPGSEEKRLGEDTGDASAAAAAAAEADPKTVMWCHRMKTTRDHAEIPELMEVLGLADLVDASHPPRAEEGNGEKDRQRWSRALEMRQGTGLSLAGQMSTMKPEAAVAAPAPAGA